MTGMENLFTFEFVGWAACWTYLCLAHTKLQLVMQFKWNTIKETREKHIVWDQEMKRSSNEQGGEASTSTSRPSKFPRLRRVTPDSASKSTTSTSGSTSAVIAPSVSGNDHLDSQGVTASTSHHDRTNTSDHHQKVVQQIRPHVAKRGLKRAGPYLLGNFHVSVRLRVSVWRVRACVSAYVWEYMCINAFWVLHYLLIKYSVVSNANISYHSVDNSHHIYHQTTDGTQ